MSMSMPESVVAVPVDLKAAAAAAAAAERLTDVLGEHTHVGAGGATHVERDVRQSDLEDVDAVVICSAKSYQEWRDAKAAETTFFGHLQPGKLHLLSGSSNTGKSSLLLWYAMNWVFGQPPWPESVPGKSIHEPWQAPLAAGGYPAPIVEHSAARKRALERYARVTSAGGD